MRIATFKLESLGYEGFEGFTKDECWNGWDCPYFTFDQAQEVLKQYNQLCGIIGQKDLAFYDLTDDAFIFPGNGEAESEIFSAVEEDGQKYYPVGAFYWIWEEVMNEFN